LFPATAAALLGSHAPRWKLPAGAAIVSIAGGYSAGWASALYGRIGGTQEWIYNAPAVALGTSLLLLLASLPYRGKGQPSGRDDELSA
jgi:hypothetical protein